LYKIIYLYIRFYRVVLSYIRKIVNLLHHYTGCPEKKKLRYLQSWYLILAKISIFDESLPSNVEVQFLAKKSEVSFQYLISTSTLR